VGRKAYTNRTAAQTCENCATLFGSLQGRAAVSKLLVCVAIALLVAGCIPIGARVSNMYVAASAGQPR